MKNIIVATLFLFLSSNAFACYDESLSGKDNFDNCLVEAEQGYASAQYNLGVMYDNGLGVAQDYKEAVKWFTKDAEQGYAEAQYNLGNMYNKGKGVLQDYKLAVKWLTKAAEQGYASAQNNLGVMYEYGQGVAQDYKSAHMWFNIAAANGNSTAAKNRDVVAKKMTPSQIEKAQDMAREWMAK
jgi:TPR repeat protein